MMDKTGGGGGLKTTKNLLFFPMSSFLRVAAMQLLPVLFEVLAGESTLVDDLHLLHYGTLPRLARAYAVQNNLSIKEVYSVHVYMVFARHLRLRRR